MYISAGHPTPSYAQGFASNPSMGKYPELLDGRVVHVAAPLGITGATVPNLAGSQIYDWVGTGGHWDDDAFTFNGTDDYIELGDIATTHPATFAAWVYPTSNSDSRLFCQNTGSTANGGALRVNSTGVDELQVWTGSTWKELALVTLNEWCQIAVTYTATTATGWINGVQQTTATSAGGFDFSGVNCGLGDDFSASGYGDSFSGSIKEAAIYNRILSASEIALHYNLGPAGSLARKDLIVPYTSAAAPAAESNPALMMGMTF